MAIDIFFGIMIVWGFYFGYVHGPIKVFLAIISIVLALLASMKFTQLTAQLMRETFETRSPYLPFLAFILTLITVLFVARIFSKIVEEGFLKSTRLNWLVQMVSALTTSATFTFLFSVLVEFATAAEVIKPAIAQKTSFSYQYIVKIPEYGKQFIGSVAPFAVQFIEYMQNASQQLGQHNAADSYEQPHSSVSLDSFMHANNIHYDNMQEAENRAKIIRFVQENKLFAPEPPPADPESSETDSSQTDSLINPQLLDSVPTVTAHD